MQKPILVTGSHRSGKTFCANGLMASGELNRVHQPLSLNTRVGLSGLKLKYWYTYINKSNEYVYKDKLYSVTKYDYYLLDQIKNINSIKDIVSIFRDLTLNLNKKLNKKRPLIDDPFALFSADWFYEAFDIDVVIMVRHPASFVASLKMLDLNFPFYHLLNQDELIKQKIAPFKDEIIEYSKEKKNVVEQGILLWRIIYYVVMNFYKHYNDQWFFVRFEDLIKSPDQEFKKMYSRLGLKYDEKTRKRLEKYLRMVSTKELRKESNMINTYIYKYPIEIQLYNFRNKLDDKEISLIKENTADIWPHFYSDEEW